MYCNYAVPRSSLLIYSLPTLHTFYYCLNQFSSIPLQNNCNKEVEWFNLVMAQQGSVKETSFGQLDACIKHGMFRVGQKGADIFHNMSDIVKLTVDSKHGRVYHLDDLKDLESKLVLITGNKDERRIAMDGFLDVSNVLFFSLQTSYILLIPYSLHSSCFIFNNCHCL